MAITLFGSVSVPVDGASATNTADPTAFANPPIASMVAGDLVFVYAWCRTASATIAVSNAGGQSWNSGTSHNAANTTLSANYFWCRYNGTWSAAPSFSFGATTNNSVVMLVFRGSFSTTTAWIISNLQGFVDRTAAASFTITGWTPSHNSNVSVGVWNTADDNTWGTLTGANWVKTSLSAQYRNTSGQDTSASLAYQIQTTAAATNNVSQTQLTLGNDAGLTFGVCFAEYDTAWNNQFVPRNIEQPYFAKTLISPSGSKMATQSIVLGDWQFRKAITIDMPASTLTDFPMLFSGVYDGTGGEPNLKSTSNGGNVTSVLGLDIAFFSDPLLTTLLKYERVKYDPATGEVEFWVKIPSLSSSSNTVIYLGYSRSGHLDTQDKPGVWDSFYKLVNHFPDGTTLDHSSSTGTNNGTNANVTATTGKINGGANFDGAVGTTLTKGNGSDMQIHTEDFTVEAWINTNSISSFGNFIRNDPNNGQNLYAFRHSNTGKLDFFISQSSIVSILGSTTLSTATWYHVVAVRDASTDLRVYLNGSSDATPVADTTGNILTTNTVYVGSHQGDERFNGIMDELRFSKGIARSADWIAASYSNQNDPANFYTISSI